MCKWLWKLENLEGTWQELLTKKYLANQTLSQAIACPGCSNLWQGLMGVNDTFKQFAEKKMNDGRKTLLWKGCWMDVPLSLKFPRLYGLTFDKEITMRRIKEDDWGYVTFRRLFHG
jgi:hypothetical protein